MYKKKKNSQHSDDIKEKKNLKIQKKKNQGKKDLLFVHILFLSKIYKFYDLFIL